MIDLISIHIPKTGGTSFYNILLQVYGDKLSKSYKRRDYTSIQNEGIDFYQNFTDRINIVHGHLYYHELKSIHYSTGAKIITWLRHPVDRVISNYMFFKQGLSDADINPINYSLNKHRRNESLMVYARRPENRNRMSAFLDGLSVDDLYFIGLLEFFNDDIIRLASLLNWPEFDIPNLNRSNDHDRQNIPLSALEELKILNNQDMELYELALSNRREF